MHQSLVVGNHQGGTLPEDDVTRERIERAVRRSRVWLANGSKEVGAALVRGMREAAERVRARSDDDTGDGAARRATVDQAAADPAAFFSQERQREAQKLGHANILVTGQTGVGKSTLINAIFRAPLADASIGRPVTDHVQRHEIPGIPVTLFDTPGIELGHSKDVVIRDFRRTITESRRRRPGDLIHVAWYCIDAGQTRIQGYDTEIVRALADEVPVILVFTQCIDEERVDALDRAVRAENLPINGTPVRTLAQPRKLGAEVLAPRGLEELVRRTHDILPEAVRRAFTNAQGVVVRLKAFHAHKIVAAASVTAAGVGAAPIPISDAVVLMPVQLGMLAGITAVFGVDISSDSGANLIRGLVGQGGVAAAGRQMATGLLKVIPGVTFINAAVAGALTAALGEAYIQLCSEMLRRKAEGKSMPDSDMLAFLLNAYQKTFKMPGSRRWGMRSRAPRPGKPAHE